MKNDNLNIDIKLNSNPPQTFLEGINQVMLQKTNSNRVHDYKRLPQMSFLHLYMFFIDREFFFFIYTSRQSGATPYLGVRHRVREITSLPDLTEVNSRMTRQRRICYLC